MCVCGGGGEPLNPEDRKEVMVGLGVTHGLKKYFASVFKETEDLNEENILDPK